MTTLATSSIATYQRVPVTFVPATLKALDVLVRPPSGERDEFTATVVVREDDTDDQILDALRAHPAIARLARTTTFAWDAS